MPPKKSSRSNRKRKKTPAKPSRFPLFRTLLWIAVAAVGGLTLFILLRLSYIQPSPDVKPPVAAAKAPTRLTKPKPAESKTTHPVVSRPPASTKAQAEVPPTYEAEADDFELKSVRWTWHSADPERFGPTAKRAPTPGRGSTSTQRAGIFLPKSDHRPTTGYFSFPGRPAQKSG